MAFFRAYVTWLTVAVAFGLWLMFKYADRYLVEEVLRVLALTFALMMMPLYASLAASCYTTPGWPDREQWGGLSMFWFSALTAVSGVFSLFYRLAGRQHWMLDLPVVNAWAIGYICYAAVFTAAPGFFGSQVSRKTRIAIALLWAMSIVACGFLALARPDAGWLADWLRNWLEHAPACR